MTKEQINAIRCAYADLKGAMEAYDASDMHSHDWTAHQMTIFELEESFPELALEE